MIDIWPYSNPRYFVILSTMPLPLIIGLYHGWRFKTYEAFIPLLSLFLMFNGKDWIQGVQLIGCIIFQFLVTFAYQKYVNSGKNKASVSCLAVILAILPLAAVKVTPLAHNKATDLVGSFGISYLTFKTMQIIMELRGKAIKKVDPITYARFLLFSPAISSGPVDRYRRFKEDYGKAPEKDEYIESLKFGIRYIFQDFLYKFIISYAFGTLWLPQLARDTLFHDQVNGGLCLSWALLGYMHCYSTYFSFDFAGYSLFAVGTSYFMGIRTPISFNKPFTSQDIKDFWNRWHMTLSFQFRNFVFVRFTFFVMKRKLVKNRIRLSQFTCLVDFLVMSFWHDLTWYYIVYGICHALTTIINDIWLRFKHKHRKQIPHNKFTKWFATFLTFNVVCFSFLIFSGFLSTLQFGWK